MLESKSTHDGICKGLWLKKDFHEKVAIVLAEKLNLSREQERVFVKAIREPDRWRRKNPRRRHHCLRTDTIIYYVVDARNRYLRGDIESCLRNLGIALHFIQDAYVPSPRNRALRRIHASIERRASGVSLNYIRSEVEEAFCEYQSSYAFVKHIVSQINQLLDAETAIKMAIRTSALITAAVFGPKEPPVDLINRLRLAREVYRKKVVKAERIALAILSIGVVLSLSTGLMGNEMLSLLLILLSLTSAPIIYMYMTVDPTYSELNEEAMWYGLAE